MPLTSRAVISAIPLQPALSLSSSSTSLQQQQHQQQQQQQQQLRQMFVLETDWVYETQRRVWYRVDSGAGQLTARRRRVVRLLAFCQLSPQDFVLKKVGHW